MLASWLACLCSVAAMSTSNAATFVGRRPLSLISFKHKKRLLSNNAILLDIRGGADSHDKRYYSNDYYGNDGSRRGDYYYSDRRGYYNNDEDDDDRGGYYDDRDKKSSSSYGYQDDDGRNDYYGYQRDDNEGRTRPGDYYDDGYSSKRDYYDDRGSSGGGGPPGMPSIIRNGNKRVGFSLLGLGAMFTMMGITSFFNKNLLRLGNLFFVAGVPMTIGPGRTAGYFFQPKKARATGCLAFGILLVFFGHPVIGMALEIFGLMNLFGNMFPLAMAMLRQMPVVGNLLPSGSRRTPTRPRENYYDDYGGDGGGPDKYY